jgi:hypothetical protein
MTDNGAARELGAGRDLDLRVALAMGWQGQVLWIDDEDGRDPYLFEPDAKPEHVVEDNRDWDCRVPNYSTNNDDALDLYNDCKKRGIALDLTAPALRRLPPPHRISLAVLEAVERAS